MKHLLFVILLSSSSFADVDLNKVVNSWESLGAMLPSKDVTKFSENLPASIVPLEKGLKHKKKHVRKSTAYVVEIIGAPAVAISPSLIKAYIKEEDAVNRVYYINALVAIQYRDADYIKNLRLWYKEQKNRQLKSTLASALIIANKSEKDASEYIWVTAMLTPMNEKLEEHSDLYYQRWESALGVSRLLRYFPVGKDELVVLVEKLSVHKDTPKWVGVHLKRHLKELEK